jgi:hypothetical protein
MRNLWIYLLVFFIFPNLSFSQNIINKVSGLNENSEEITVKRLVIKTTNFNYIEIDGLKNELIGWKEKVISVIINEKAQELTITHNLLMDSRELFEVLKKHQLKKEDIVSYK